MKRTLCAALLGSLLLAMTSCGTARRLGKDALIAISSPYVILHGASTDGVIDAKNVQKGFEASDWVQYAAFPLAFMYRAVDHTVSTAIYIGDIFFTPLYALAEIHPDSDIQPLGIYRGTPFGTWPDGPDPAAGTADTETGAAATK